MRPASGVGAAVMGHGRMHSGSLNRRPIEASGVPLCTAAMQAWMSKIFIYFQSLERVSGARLRPGSNPGILILLIL
jgi:hypothetical protein